MPKCSECKTSDGTISAVIQGKYHANLCPACKALLNAGQTISSGAARWSRTIDAEDHEADIQQPWNKDGTINGKFVRLYPEQAKALFSEEEMRRAT